jgi:Protein of unknown function (DUF3300)
MKASARLRVLGTVLLVCAFALAGTAQEPAAAPAAEAPAFTPDQLDAMTAPIALYPDSLVMQIMMGATYPLEIVEAARWVKANPGLEGTALEEALKQQDWDVAVKALCGFPDVVTRMNDNLDWTQDLGDAFLAQQADVLDAVQRMRGEAYKAGNLKTTEQQVVTQQPDKIIVIESADPQVVYVPTYSPQVVYPAPPPPTYYPAMYAPPPPGTGMMMFATGMMWGAALSGGCNWGWGSSDVNIDIDRNTEFNRNTNVNSSRTNVQNKGGGKGSWSHDPAHRGGVNYKNGQTAQKYGAKGGSTRATQSQARGYSGSGKSAGATSARQGGASSASRASPAASSRQGTGAAQRPSTSSAQRPASSGQRASASPSRSSGSQSAFGGSRSPSSDRAASSRGSASRSGGGGGRSGGGGGRRR